ncbi:MAG: formate/nitrite transporter family protein [Rhodospirillales bacterium]
MTDENRNPIDPASFDAYAPDRIALRIEAAGITKGTLPVVPTLTLAFLAGAFIALGAMFYLVTITQSGLGFGPTRFIGGIAFSLGLILVIVGGAELFTGNVLLVMGWAHKKVSGATLWRNWGLVYAGNLAGAVAMALMAWWAGIGALGGGELGVTLVKVAAAKVALPFDVAFVRGILCNVLVCLAVWLSFAAHSVVSKILAIVFPIAAFVALGFEHSIANMFFIPAGIFLAGDPAFAEAAGTTVAARADIAVLGLLHNLVPVTLGNIVGGGVFVALSYYLAYLYGRD